MVDSFFLLYGLLLFWFFRRVCLFTPVHVVKRKGRLKPAMAACFFLIGLLPRWRPLQHYFFRMAIELPGVSTRQLILFSLDSMDWAVAFRLVGASIVSTVEFSLT